MKAYHVDDSQNWDIVLDTFREALLNENYELSCDIREIIGNGAVLSFRNSVVGRKTSFMNDYINFIEVPETDEYGLILKSVDEIAQEIRSEKDNELQILDDVPLEKLTGDTSKLAISDLSDEVIEKQPLSDDKLNNNPTDTIISDKDSDDNKKEPVAIAHATYEPGMRILFGTNEQNGEEVIWKPNDTTQLFHTNTGIIGTMWPLASSNLKKKTEPGVEQRMIQTPLSFPTLLALTHSPYSPLSESQKETSV